MIIDGQSYLLLIRDEGGAPEMQVSNCPLLIPTPLLIVRSCTHVCYCLVGKNVISLSESVTNFSVLLDNSLSMNKFISRISQSFYYQLRLISCIRKYLSAEATPELVTSVSAYPVLS